MAGGDRCRRLLAADDHALLQAASEGRHAALFSVLIAGYGPPGSAEVLALVKENGYCMLRSAIRNGRLGGFMVSSLLGAVGKPGSAAVLDVLEASGALDLALCLGRRKHLHHKARRWDAKRNAALRQVLSAYGKPGSETMLAAIGNNKGYWKFPGTCIIGQVSAQLSACLHRVCVPAASLHHAHVPDARASD